MLQKRSWTLSKIIFRKPYWKITLFSLGVFFIVIGLANFQKLIKITKVECLSQYGNCPDSIVNGLKLLINSDLKLSKKQIEELLDNNLQVNNYLIQFRIPSTLKVELNLDKPAYATFDFKSYHLISSEGIVVEVVSESNLPTLINSKSYAIGEKIADKDLFALKLIEKLNYLYSTKQGEAGEKELRVKLNEQILIRFPLEGDLDVLVGSLRLIFSRLNDDTGGIRMKNGDSLVVNEIDLRFKNVVVK